MEAFKIKNKDGLFSTGGTNPRFTKRGKTWGNLAHLSSHLTNYTSGQYGIKQNIPDDWIITRLSENGITEFNAKQYKLDKTR